MESLLKDARFERFSGVFKNRAELAPIMRERFLERSTDDWWQSFRKAGIWPAPFEVDGWRGARSVGSEYGEHTDEILRELDYSDDELVELRVENAIW